MTLLTAPSSLVEETLQVFKAAGDRNRECVALWLTPKGSAQSKTVREVYIPEHIAELDFFKIPAHSMRSLMAHLREENKIIAAQVHSHPENAFHSHADDKWAIVRRRGALSIVVPYFGYGVTPHNFLEQAAFFQVAIDGSWIEVPLSEISTIFEICQ